MIDDGPNTSMYKYMEQHLYRIMFSALLFAVNSFTYYLMFIYLCLYFVLRFALKM
jgi:hypothetical protein